MGRTDPVLWRVHRMHHAGPDFDAATGLRFHPVEILLSMAIKFTVVLLIDRHRGGAGGQRS